MPMPAGARSLGIGMAVEGASGNFGLGDLLGEQVKDDTDEERKRKMKEMQDRALMGPAAASIGIGLGGIGHGI